MRRWSRQWRLTLYIGFREGGLYRKRTVTWENWNDSCFFDIMFFWHNWPFCWLYSISFESNPLTPLHAPLNGLKDLTLPHETNDCTRTFSTMTAPTQSDVHQDTNSFVSGCRVQAHEDRKCHHSGSCQVFVKMTKSTRAFLASLSGSCILHLHRSRRRADDLHTKEV